MKIYRDDKVAHSLLKLLDSVGKYINAKKATAHPDSIKLLHSIHANLQRVVTSKTITVSQSSQILSTEIAKFKNLKQQLLKKAEPPPSKAVTTDVNINGPKDSVLQVIDELKKLIQEEFKSLREELKQLRQ